MSLPAFSAEISIEVDATQDLHRIHAWIYGTNSDALGQAEGVAFRRAGGNRMTGYNWENNASNAGSDWQHSSDTYLGGGLTPGKTITNFHDKSLDLGTASLVTLEAAGFVARDKKGTVSENEKAPSNRWVAIEFAKNAPFSDIPDTTDAKVYMDEQVAFLVKQYGLSQSEKGIQAYSIDNEPALWVSTHPRIHPDTPSCFEITQKNNALAAAIKAVDPGAEVFGGVFFGYSAMNTFQSAKDWDSIQTQGKYTWFLDYFLDEARKASAKAGKRLIDVLDLHWYSEAQGDHRITESNATSNLDVEARLQAPRSLWDTSYTETSWISKWATPKKPVTDWSNPTPGPIGLLPQVFKSIAQYYPGTKVAFTEWNYGGQNHISGGIATADVLGIFGRENLYAANFWPLNDTLPFVQAAFQLFRNADGKGLAFGSMNARAKVGNDSLLSAYASFDPEGKSLHLIVLNKSNQAIDGKMNFHSPVTLVSGHVFGFDGTSSHLTDLGGVSNFSATGFTATLPPLSARHYIFQAESPFPSVGLLSRPPHLRRAANRSQLSPHENRWNLFHGFPVFINGRKKTPQSHVQGNYPEKRGTNP